MGDHAGCHACLPDVDLVHIAGEGVDVHPGCRTGPGGARSLPTGGGRGTSAPCKLQRSSVCDAQHPSCNCCPAPRHGACRRWGAREALCRPDQHRNTLAGAELIIWGPLRSDRAPLLLPLPPPPGSTATTALQVHWTCWHQGPVHCCVGNTTPDGMARGGQV